MPQLIVIAMYSFILHPWRRQWAESRAILRAGGVYYLDGQIIHNFTRHHRSQSPHDFSKMLNGDSRQVRVQNNVDVVLLNSNCFILVACGESSDDNGERLLRVIRAGQPNICAQSGTRLYGVVHRVRTRGGGEHQALRLSYQLKKVRIGLVCG